MAYLIQFLTSLSISTNIESDAIQEPTDETKFTELITHLGIENENVNWTDYLNFKKKLVTKENIIHMLQPKRDQLLKDSDWVLTYDNAMSLANLDAWVAYRQALRDLMAAARADPTSVVFPEKPPIIRKA
jgi:hypothetical protein